MKPNQEKHNGSLPNARKIRRACSKELYRTVKKLNRFIPPDKVEQAEALYYRKVMLNLPWIHENGSNRKVLSDWWEEQVGLEIAHLWEVDQDDLNRAFRKAFGG